MFVNDDNGKRGQVGIGTLIVFIAMVLVAAIAAGVLINTAGFLQTQAEATGEESTEQVSNNIDVISSYGEVAEEDEIDDVEMTIAPAAGSDEIDMTEATIQLIGPEGAETLTYPDDGGTGEGEFDLSGIGDDADDEVLLDGSDRMTVELSLQENDLGDGTDGNLEEGDTADVTITLQSGAQTTEQLRVPDSLNAQDDGQDVAL